VRRVENTPHQRDGGARGEKQTMKESSEKIRLKIMCED